MKSIFFTALFVCIGVIAFAQSPAAAAKTSDHAKGEQCLPLAGRTTQARKALIPNASLSYRPAISVISIIPTLKLWLLPASFPNPFTKEEE